LQRITDERLERFEREHPQGITSQEILDTLAAHDIKFSEATLRKYVQLGLLPRSVRVGRKGKHQGSQGMYPAAVIRQIQRIRDMMAENFTIEEIQREFLFVRGDIEDLERSIAKVFDVLREHAKDKRSETAGRAIAHDLAAAEQLANDLLSKLTVIEERLMAQAQLQRRVAVG
jgi:DNA-binding transcriptional MerR regulator